MASLTIARLSEHLDATPVLAAWFAREWGDGTPDMTEAAIAERLAAQTDPDKLPITLLGLLGGEPVATATLKHRELDWAPKADYWLGSLYVREDMRGRGFARAMVDAAEVALYHHLGWGTVGATVVGGKRATILRKTCRASDRKQEEPRCPR